MLTNQLPRLMEQRDISIRQLSRLTGITYTTIWAVYHGQRRSVQLDVLDAICAALQVQPGDIYQHHSAGAKGLPVIDPESALDRARPAAAAKANSPRPDRPTNKAGWRNW